MRALLDVNVLIALLDAGHLHHRLATDWLAAHLIGHVGKGFQICRTAMYPTLPHTSCRETL
jgi:hypothetical protein